MELGLLGRLGGLLLSVVFVLAACLGGDVILVLAPVFALSSAASAAGSLALARMAEDREYLDSSADGPEAWLTEGDQAKTDLTHNG
jgi:predicted membrane metal-binding protein